MTCGCATSTGDDRDFRLSLRSDAILRIALEGEATRTITVPADSTLQQRVYVTARDEDPASDAADRT